jgi:hypothetical protein
MPSDVAVLIKRWRAMLGLRGLAGIIMTVIAVGALMMAWRLHLEQLGIEQRADRLAYSANAAPASKPATRSMEIASLPYARQHTSVLRQIDMAAQKLGLAWSKVDYSHQPLSENNLASMDIKGVMRGPYPAVRDFLAEVLSTQPSTALRSLILTRDSAESIDIEARISLTVFLADGWRPADSPQRLPAATP